MKRFFTSPAASHISSCSGLPFKTPLPMAGLERSCAASSEKAWLWKMVSRPLMPGRMLLRPPPKPAIT